MATESTIKLFVKELATTYCPNYEHKILINERTPAAKSSRTLSMVLLVAGKSEQPETQRLLDKLQILERLGDIEGTRGFLIAFKGTKLLSDVEKGLMVDHVFIEITMGVIDPDNEEMP